MLAEDSHPITVSLTLEDPCNGEQVRTHLLNIFGSCSLVQKLFSITLNHVQMDSGASLRLYVDTPSLQTITNLVLPASFNKTVDCGSDTSSNLPATTSTSIKNSDVEPPDVSTLANCSLPLPSTPRKHLLSETAPISSRQKRPKFNALLCSTPEALSVARKELHIDSDSDGSATEPDEEDFAHDVDHSRTTGAGPPKYLDPSHLKWYMSETIDVLQNPERSPRRELSSLCQ